MPEIGLSDSIRTKFLTMWANNGDIISKQYAGTNALKVVCQNLLKRILSEQIRLLYLKKYY